MKMKEAEKGSKAGDIRQRGCREVKCWEKRAGEKGGAECSRLCELC